MTKCEFEGVSAGLGSGANVEEGVVFDTHE